MTDEVYLIGGPMMGKKVVIDPRTRQRGRYSVQWVDAPNMFYAYSVNPQTDLTIKNGYYQPTKNPKYWSFVGKYEAPLDRKIKRAVKNARAATKKFGAACGDLNRSYYELA